jgi:hypothetical protein
MTMTDTDPTPYRAPSASAPAYQPLPLDEEVRLYAAAPDPGTMACGWAIILACLSIFWFILGYLIGSA